MNTPAPTDREKISDILASRYTYKELMKAQDVIGDFVDGMKVYGFTVEQCDYLFDLLTETLKSTAN